MGQNAGHREAVQARKTPCRGQKLRDGSLVRGVANLLSKSTAGISMLDAIPLLRYRPVLLRLYYYARRRRRNFGAPAGKIGWCLEHSPVLLTLEIFFSLSRVWSEQ